MQDAKFQALRDYIDGLGDVSREAITIADHQAVGVHAIIANAYATLAVAEQTAALVEQQRLANVIAARDADMLSDTSYNEAELFIERQVRAILDGNPCEDETSA